MKEGNIIHGQKANLEALKFVGIIDFTKCKIKDIAQKWSTFPH